MVQFIFSYFIFINVFTFIAFGVDKWRARHNQWRISEAALFLFAILGGSIGALLGMHIWHHKTRHLHFVIGIPLIMLLQVILIFALSRFLSSLI
jgi:uncharacterized membrane protein YsdA (DUF1294 family)